MANARVDYRQIPARASSPHSYVLESDATRRAHTSHDDDDLDDDIPRVRARADREPYGASTQRQGFIQTRLSRLDRRPGGVRARVEHEEERSHLQGGARYLTRWGELARASV